jgi:hypothetical protein
MLLSNLYEGDAPYVRMSEFIDDDDAVLNGECSSHHQHTQLSVDTPLNPHETRHRMNE